nr:hypothetical protein [Planctomycetota bacterium]
MNERLEELLGRWALGALDDAESAELLAQVRDDPAARQQFVDFASLHRLATATLSKTTGAALAKRVLFVVASTRSRRLQLAARVRRTVQR